MVERCFPVIVSPPPRTMRRSLSSPCVPASQPKQINEIKDFLLTARRKDAKCTLSLFRSTRQPHGTSGASGCSMRCWRPSLPETLLGGLGQTCGCQRTDHAFHQRPTHILRVTSVAALLLLPPLAMLQLMMMARLAFPRSSC